MTNIHRAFLALALLAGFLSPGDTAGGVTIMPQCPSCTYGGGHGAEEVSLMPGCPGCTYGGGHGGELPS
jgi:hypothetical protein